MLVQDYCTEHGLELSQIWLTHWHKDHIGGVPDLIQKQSLPVYGPKAELEKFRLLTIHLNMTTSSVFMVLRYRLSPYRVIPLGHIVYFLDAIDVLFCGDTLFAMGCGRVFEGTYQQMYHSLARLAALPPRTQVYCTHEYTLSNAQFAKHVEPDNPAILERFEQVERMRMLGQCTLPSTIAAELETNPFYAQTVSKSFNVYA